MYNFLTGILAEKLPTAVTLDVSGVGYHLIIPLSTSQKLPETGEKLKLFAHLVVREDAHLLFGFATEEERSLFRLLVSVSGVGPKLAITALSGLGVSELKKAIVQGELHSLTAISGIGRKTAERLIIELREKIVVESYGEEGKAAAKLPKNEVLVEDSLKALVSLGYSKQNAKTAIQKVLTARSGDRLNAETLIRESLKHI